MNRWSMTVIVAVIIAMAIPLVLMFVNKNETVRFDDSPLHIGANQGEFGNVEKAFEAGANINAQDEYGKTALHHAAENGHNQTSKSILALARAGNHTKTAKEIEWVTGMTRKPE